VQLDPHVAQLRCCQTCRAIYRTDFERCPTDGTPLSFVEVDPLIGATVAKHYTIDALIAEGGMGRVYRAHHSLLLHRKFAVKVMIGDLAATIAMRLRFGQEADSASRLAHPNVVSVIDFGKTDEGLLFLVMDLIDGRTLAEVIAAEAPLEPRRALMLARQICDGLAHAHERGLVHRDFKPENVIIESRIDGEHAVITDFGIAISSETDDDAPARLTSTGITLGTPIYAAPEQTHGLRVDHRADLFAVGVTLYEMLAGRLPFDGSGLEVIHQNATGKPPAIELRSGVRVIAPLEVIVRRLMAPLPGDRFESATDVIDALTIVDTLLIAPAPPPPPPTALSAPAMPVAPAMRNARAAVAVAAIAIASIAVLTQKTSKRDARVAPRVTGVASSSPVHPSPPTNPVVASVRPSTIASPPAQHPVVASVRSSTIESPPAQHPVVASVRPSAITKPPPRMPRRVPRPPPTVVVPLSEPPRTDEQRAEPISIDVAAPLAPPLSVPLPPPPATVLVTRARADIGSLDVRGSLSNAVIRRAVDRLMPQLRTCFANVATTSKRSLAATVHATFVIDGSKRAVDIRTTSPTWPALAACVASTMGDLRTRDAPDVGTVSVSVDVLFQPEVP
jgi:serine/threonine protein kinase